MYIIYKLLSNDALVFLLREANKITVAKTTVHAVMMFEVRFRVNEIVCSARGKQRI